MRALTIGIFLIIVAITLGITYWAARRTHTTSEFYAAGRSLRAHENGFALAGDWMSAASFLGFTGLVAIYGLDGSLYAAAALVAFLVVLLLIAEPLRNTGKYTMADCRVLKVSRSGYYDWKDRPLSKSRDALIEAMGWALSTVSARDARGFFEHCGYRPQVQLLGTVL